MGNSKLQLFLVFNLRIFILMGAFMRNMKLHGCQLALFVNSGSMRADFLSADVRRVVDIGEFEPLIIPEAPGMPNEFPRLQIGSDKGYQLTMSKVRVDFHLNLPLGLSGSDVGVFVDKCKLLLGILNEYGVSLSRVGYVFTYFIEGSDQSRAVVKKLLTVFDDDVSEVNISITKRFNVCDSKCNNLYGFVSAVSASGVPGLVVSRDVNTVPEAGQVFDLSFVSKFIDAVHDVMGEGSVAEFLG